MINSLHTAQTSARLSNHTHCTLSEHAQNALRIGQHIRYNTSILYVPGVLSLVTAIIPDSAKPLLSSDKHGYMYLDSEEITVHDGVFIGIRDNLTG